MKFEDCLFELNYIIEHMTEELRNKIPLEIREEIKKRMSKEAYMLIKDYKESTFSEDTKIYLSVLYSEFICSSSEKWKNFDDLFQKNSN